MSAAASLFARVYKEQMTSLQNNYRLGRRKGSRGPPALKETKAQQVRKDSGESREWSASRAQEGRLAKE